MNDKKQKLLSAVWLWAISRGMEEITDDENYTCHTDVTFSKDDKIYGFLTEPDRDAQKLQHASVFARSFCDYVYIVTDDEKKREYIKENSTENSGILCYSNPFGFGMTYQVLKEALLIN